MPLPALFRRLRRPAMLMAGLLVILAGSAGGLWLAHQQGVIPKGDDPWARLDLTAAPGWFTKRQLAALRDDPRACFAVLDAAGLRYRRLPNPPILDGCGIADGLEWSGPVDGPKFRTPLRMTCPLAAGLALLLRPDLQDQADRLIGSKIAWIESFGTYNCRNIKSDEPSTRRSEHAKGNAIDLAGVTTLDGRQILVAKDWGRGGAGALLALLHDRACALFSVTLGPDYNALHHNHLHLDQGPFSACE